MDEMKRIVVCRHCSKPEYYGDFRWYGGRQMCRACYRHDYELRTGERYTWPDLDGPVPTLEEFRKQEGR